MRITLFCVHSAAALARESAGYVWQFKIRILHLCGLSTEHQNSSVDIEFYEEFVLPCSHVAFCFFHAVCTESDGKLNSP